MSLANRKAEYDRLVMLGREIPKVLSDEFGGANYGSKKDNIPLAKAQKAVKEKVID